MVPSSGTAPGDGTKLCHDGADGMVPMGWCRDGVRLCYEGLCYDTKVGYDEKSGPSDWRGL